MFTFTHIEDYLEVLASFRNVSYHGQAPGPLTNFFGRFSKQQSGLVALARYDVNIVHSLAESTIDGKALTDKQAELAIRLVSKYKKQFLKLNVDVTPSIENPKFRHPIRFIDRSKSVQIKDNRIVILKFPYDKELVRLVSEASKESHGTFKFDHDLKEWHLAITESNINWVCNLATYGFDIGSNVLELMQLVLDCEKNNFKIELEYYGNMLRISNAEPTLIQYVENNLGGFSKDNLIKLVDCSALCGVTVSSNIRDDIEETHGTLLTALMLNKDSHYMRQTQQSGSKNLLVTLSEYANLTNRWPIYVYEPEIHETLINTAKSLFDEEEILYADKKANLKNVDVSKIKIVYFKKLKYVQHVTSSPIPILLSTTAMLVGFDRQSCLLNSEKIVLYTATAYNKEIKTIASDNNN